MLSGYRDKQNDSTGIEQDTVSVLQILKSDHVFKKKTGKKKEEASLEISHQKL